MAYLTSILFFGEFEKFIEIHFVCFLVIRSFLIWSFCVAVLIAMAASKPQFFPNQGFPQQTGNPFFPNQNFQGQGFPNQGFPGQGFPNQGFPGQQFSNQGEYQPFVSHVDSTDSTFEAPITNWKVHVVHQNIL